MTVDHFETLFIYKITAVVFRSIFPAGLFLTPLACRSHIRWPLQWNVRVPLIIVSCWRYGAAQELGSRRQTFADTDRPIGVTDLSPFGYSEHRIPVYGQLIGLAFVFNNRSDQTFPFSVLSILMCLISLG